MQRSIDWTRNFNELGTIGPQNVTLQFFLEKNTSPKWRSRRWLEIAQKLFHHRVGDKILRQKFCIHLSPISNNKGATAPRKLPFGLTFFEKFISANPSV